jgi:hypothetical protein
VRRIYAGNDCNWAIARLDRRKSIRSSLVSITPFWWGRLMPLQFLVGGSVSVVNIMIHALITLVAVGIARRAGIQNTTRPRLHLMTVMVGTALMLMVAHTVEIVLWSLAYAAVGAAPAGSDLLDFAFVNYTTLGYGDVTPLKEWRLIGPMTAMNGILMFGWSTAVLFEVLRKTIEHLALIGSSEGRFNPAGRG